jgi:hypothetical protein
MTKMSSEFKKKIHPDVLETPEQALHEYNVTRGSDRDFVTLPGLVLVSCSKRLIGNMPRAHGLIIYQDAKTKG